MQKLLQNEKSIFYNIHYKLAEGQLLKFKIRFVN